MFEGTGGLGAARDELAWKVEAQIAEALGVIDRGETIAIPPTLGLLK